METSSLICSAHQLTGFNMKGTSVMKDNFCHIFTANVTVNNKILVKVLKKAVFSFIYNGANHQKCVDDQSLKMLL